MVNKTSTASCILGAFLLSCVPTKAADAARSTFTNAPPSYLLQVNGHTYRQKNSTTRRAPASLTKMMTALIVIEQLDLDEVVTVSRGAARETGCRIGLRRGDRLKVRDLLAAALMHSANDACRALADHAAGSQKAFVAVMNARAKRMQLHGTHFTNVSGHDDEGHYSTARDLAILAESAMRNPIFANVVTRRTMRITTVNGRRTFYLKNTNRLIGRYPGARGVKTGTTPAAGQCLVAMAQRKDTRVLLVILRSRNRWRAAPAMLDAAFATQRSHIGANDAGADRPAINLTVAGEGIDASAPGRTDDGAAGPESSNGSDGIGIAGSSDNSSFPINESFNDGGDIDTTNDAVIRNSTGKIKPTRELR